tara:strand:+ start:4442 stop:5359 length:918 start_codon:yes stop_codon:yes gene_type:complete
MTPHEHAQISYGQQWNDKISKRINILKDYVTYKPDCSGRYATIEQYGDLDLEEKTARFEEKAAVELPTARAFIFPKNFERTVHFDEDDEWKLNRLGVPMPESAKRLMEAGERVAEDIIIDAILGTTTIGNGADEAMTTEILDGDQVVAVNLGGGANTNLTQAKILESIRVFMDNDAWGQGTDDNESLCMGVTPKALFALWTDSMVTSSDFRSFAGGKPFDKGVIETFLGVKFLVSSRFSRHLSTNTQSCPMWLKSKVAYGDWKKSTTRVWETPGNGATNIRFKFRAGAVREEKKGVVNILCDITA